MVSGLRVAVAAGAVVLACGSLAAGAPAGETPRNFTVMLTLADGVAPRADHQREGKDIEIELVVKDGQWQKDAWAYALWFNRADHDGQIVTADGDASAAKLHVKLRINKDKWFPSGPGSAGYDIDIKREGDGYAGTYTGTFQYPGGPENSAVKGKVTGQVFPLWMCDAGACGKLTPADHPRVIFRKADMPALKNRMATPEGKVILERIVRLAAAQGARVPGPGKLAPYPAAGLGVAYQLTGDKKYADQARHQIEAVMGQGRSGLRQDIHFGPHALGSAVAYDCCYDAWEPAFRAKVTDWLNRKVRDLASGSNIGTFAPNPWHNHNGVRIGGCGTAAIALLGEKDSSGKPLAGLERIIHINARDCRRYFELGGVSATGWCLEGAFYKRMTWNSGPGHLVRAYNCALGGDLVAGLPSAYAILGEWMEGTPSERLNTGDLGVGKDQTAGLWPTGLCCIDPAKRAGVRWLYDHTFGLEGNRSFGFDWAFHGAYVLTDYPFDVQPAAPGASLPWIAPDVRKGHWLFRRPWKGRDDFLMVLHNKSEVMPGCHYERSGATMDMQLWALGKLWVGSQRLTENEGGGAALPAMQDRRVPGNTFLGAKTTCYSSTPDGKTVLSLNMDEPYYQRLELARGEKPNPAALKPGQSLATFPRSGWYVDPGIKAERFLAVDASDACGAPVLLVFFDRFGGEAKPIWMLRLAREAGPCKVEGSTFTVGDPAGANMKGTFVAPKGAKVESGVSATGGKEFLVVITIQNGAAPAVTAEGEGAAAKITVGGQTITFDSAGPGKLVLSK